MITDKIKCCEGLVHYCISTIDRPSELMIVGPKMNQREWYAHTRLTAVKFLSDAGPILLVSAYLPTDNGDTECKEDFIAACSNIRPYCNVQTV